MTRSGLDGNQTRLQRIDSALATSVASQARGGMMGLEPTKFLGPQPSASTTSASSHASADGETRTPGFLVGNEAV